MAEPSASLTGRKPSEFVDAATVMRIKNLQLRAKVIVEGFYNGLHRSPYHGFSVEFSEYRQYSPGDDPRYIDWRLLARTDRLFIKRFEDETNRRAHFVVDFSRSMGYRSIEHSKIEYARTVAATLGYYLTLQRDNIGLFTFDEGVIDYLPARFRTGHFRRVLGCLDREPEGKGTDLSAPLEQVATLVKKRGLVILISDLLASIETLDKTLGYLRARGHEVLLLRILDPAEVDFPFDQASLFRDTESDKELYIDPSVAREKYREQFSQHDQALQKLCASQGIDYRTLRTDAPIEKALFDMLAVQAKRGRQFMRSRGNDGRMPGGSSA